MKAALSRKAKVLDLKGRFPVPRVRKEGRAVVSIIM